MEWNDCWGNATSSICWPTRCQCSIEQAVISANDCIATWWISYQQNTRGFNSHMVETAHLQWKIANIGEKQRQTASFFTLYRKSMSLNTFSVGHLLLEVELMYLLSMCRHYRHKSHRKWPVNTGSYLQTSPWISNSYSHCWIIPPSVPIRVVNNRFGRQINSAEQIESNSHWVHYVWLSPKPVPAVCLFVTKWR